MPPKFCIRSLLLLIISLSFLLPGCSRMSPGDRMIADANKTNMHRLCNLYNYHQAKNGWKGPKGEAEFRDFINSQQPRILERMGVDPSAVDSLFVSDRDGKPFVIRYGVSGTSRGSREAIVFEAVGVNGKRLVGFTSSEQLEVDSAEYDRLLNPPKQQ